MAKIYGEAYRHVRICVDSYDGGNPVGRYYHPSLEGGGSEFRSLSELLLGVDRLMDRDNFPQSFTEKRGFLDVPEAPASEPRGSPDQRGSAGTFLIRIMFRQHTSWQGTVNWLEGHRESSFRSVLELIYLMDSALSSSGAV